MASVETEYSSYRLGLTDKRSRWLICWLRDKVSSGHVEMALGFAAISLDLRSGQGTLYSIRVHEWHHFLQGLSDDAMVTSEPSGLWLTPGSRLLEVGAIKVHCKRDVPPVRPHNHSG